MLRIIHSSVMVSTRAVAFLVTAFYLIFEIDGSYVGSPSNTPPIQAVFQRSLNLSCSYVGTDGDGEFIGWFKDNELILEKKNHETYKVTTTGKMTQLEIIKFTSGRDDIVKRWSVQTKKVNFKEPAACSFTDFQILPSPKTLTTDRKSDSVLTIAEEENVVRRHVGESFTLICHIEPIALGIDPSKVKWTFSRDKTVFEALPGHVRVNGSEIHIEKLGKDDRGMYQCSYNNVSIAVRLRIKDQFSALIPFIGIVVVVLACVAIILLIERRQKAKSKSNSTENNPKDLADEPLVRPSNGTNNDENKKTTAEA